jgi:uncharacterized membrane protein YgcG
MTTAAPRPNSRPTTAATTTPSLEQQLVDLNAQIRKLEAERASLAQTFPFDILAQRQRALQLDAMIDKLKLRRQAVAQALEKREYPQITNRVTGDRVTTEAVRSGEIAMGQRLSRGNKNELIRNVGMVQEAYFSSLQSFQKTFNLQTNNRPAQIKSADQLWTSSAGSKGLIQTFVPRAQLSNIQFDTFLPADVKQGNSRQRRWGFQFHYNPGSIDMTYGGIPDIDIGYVASGRDPFNLVGTQVSQSTIEFQLVLNRVFDMQYYTASGALRASAPPSLYSPSRPSAADQKLIFNRGTMYDVEFFLSAVLGFRAATQFRGNTADLGWIGGHPVELYLGRSLKYLAVTRGASLKHIIFNERMVPTFSTLSLSFNRIPDYASGSSGSDTSATGISQNTSASPPPPRRPSSAGGVRGGFSNGGGFSGGGGGGGGGGGV